MRIFLPLICVLGLLLIAGYVIYAQNQSAQNQPVNDKAKVVNNENNSNFWAGISINQPVFRGSTAGLNLSFALVNDGKTVIDPKISSSKLVVNGKEISVFLITSGPEDNKFSRLPSGDYILFARNFGEAFKNSGTYHIYWKGDEFRSSEIVLRVLPDIK